MTDRPRQEAAETVYSNFDHILNEAVVKQLETNPDLYAAHTAWNFCGYVWYAAGVWYEQVWQHGFPNATTEGATIQDVIAFANDNYGRA